MRSYVAVVISSSNSKTNSLIIPKVLDEAVIKSMHILGHFPPSVGLKNTNISEADSASVSR
jgi:hypothetical protein